LRSILATIKDRVANQVKEARAANGERAELEDAVHTAISQWTQNQAVAIADSEATEAYNEGTLTAAELGGATSVFVVEEEDAPDAECQEARFQVWDIAKARANRKQHPRCRRAFIAMTEPEVA
jgi:hypothetical protein